MAGSGYKTFVAGQALTAAQVQGYLQDQAVQVYASTAARSSALGTAVSEGMVSYRTDENALEWYTGSAWETVRQPQVAGKNAIINGAFDIWQRGTSPTWTANNSNNYQADRWNAYSAVSGRTVTRQATSDTTNLPNIQYCARVQRTAANTATDTTYIIQMFESTNSKMFAGQTVTLSFYARAGANYSASSSLMTAYVYSGTGTDENFIYPGYTGGATPISYGATLTTTWKRFSVTGTISSSANELSVQFGFAPVGTAGAADYFEVTGVQLEAGSVATPFSRNASSIQGELAACRRYLPVLNAGSNIIGYAYATNAAAYDIKFDVPARVAPTGITVSGTFNAYALSTATAVTPAFANASVDTAQVTASFTITGGQGSQLSMAAGSLLLFTGCEL